VLKAVKLYVSKFLLLVVALQILNLSVCGGEDDALSSGGNTKVLGEANQIDCLAEYVTEIMFDSKNTFQENGVHNNNGNHSLVLKHVNLKMCPSYYDYILIANFSTALILSVPLKEDYRYLFSKKVIPEPPNCLYHCV
jgi:hypothetical protein